MITDPSPEACLELVAQHVLPERPSDRRAGDVEDAAIIGLDEHADRPAAELRRQPARAGADAPLPAERDRAGAGADRPFRDWPRLGGGDRGEGTVASHAARANVIQIGLADGSGQFSRGWRDSFLH